MSRSSTLLCASLAVSALWQPVASAKEARSAITEMAWQVSFKPGGGHIKWEDDTRVPIAKDGAFVFKHPKSIQAVMGQFTSETSASGHIVLPGITMTGRDGVPHSPTKSEWSAKPK